MSKQSKKSTYLLGILFLLFAPSEEVLAQYRIEAIFYTEQEQARLGERIHRHDENGDGQFDFFISAPGAKVGDKSNAGKIYLYHSPVRKDTVMLGEADVIMEGDEFDQYTGRKFEPGNFNDDEHIDLAVSDTEALNTGSGKVNIYYGPFEPGTPRSYSDSDVTITSVGEAEKFGVSLTAVPDWNDDGQDELLIGGNKSNQTIDWGGAAYLFNDVSAVNELTSEDRDVLFTGTDGNGRFGGAVAAFDDMNGDGEVDIAIGAHRESSKQSNAGAVYLYNAPFENEVYEDQNADAKIYGRDSLMLWGAKVFNAGDIEGDGLEDMVIVSYEDNRVAYFQGRNNWAPEIQIGNPNEQEGAEHTLFSRFGINEKTGADLDFRGDYNLDDINDPLIGAPNTVFRYERGAVASFTMSGEPIENIAYGPDLESEFGSQIEAAGDVYSASEDSLTLNGDLTVLDIEDVLISAPGADFTREDNSEFSSGLVYLYTGEFKEPKNSLSLSPARDIELGDTLFVEAGYTGGSKPIVSNWLAFGRDTTYLGTEENGRNPINLTFTRDTAVSQQIELYVQDSLGFNSRQEKTINFAAKPMPFDLISDKSGDTLEIVGDPEQTTSFDFESTADTNGYPIRYRMVLSTADTVTEVSNSDLNRFQYTQARPIDLSYSNLNEFLIDKGVARGQPVQIYWGVQAYNGVFHTTASQGKLRPLSVVRKGLDPYFRLTSGEEPLVIEGRSTQTYTFNWTELQTQDANATVQYDFKLMKEPDDFENPIYKKRTANQGMANSFDLSLGTADSLLKAHDLKQQAETDTASLYYTVEAIEDGQISWLPTNKSLEKEIIFKNIIIVGNEKPQNQLPEEFKVYDNYPNPFNPSTTIKYALPEAQIVTLTVYNILGRVVYRWSSSGAVAAGFRSHRIEAHSWSSGIYIYRLKAGDQRQSGKMLLVK